MNRLEVGIALAGLSSSAVDTRDPRYQSIKGRVHEELLNRLNLERLTRTRREDAEPEIRGVISGLLDRETLTTPLSSYERDNLITDVLNELFGLGPLEALLSDATRGYEVRRRPCRPSRAACPEAPGCCAAGNR